jgi:hypothetical protein
MSKVIAVVAGVATVVAVSLAVGRAWNDGRRSAAR